MMFREKSGDNIGTVDVKPCGVFAVNRSHSSRRRLRAKGDARGRPLTPPVECQLSADSVEKLNR
jgi:hypothetical protein